VSLTVTLACAVLMALIARGVYTLQWWLEQSDYRRHFED
jgi:hypothetical protein